MKRGEIDDLVAFAAIARARSFTRAAAELDVSPSALSHTMKGLETRLGVRLLARTTRSVALTPAGERLLHYVTAGVEQIEAGISAMSEWSGDPSGSIKITCARYSAQSILAPMLPSFLLANPKICVEVSVDSRLTDLVRDGFDAGIRFGNIVPQDMVAVRVGAPERLIVVGSPAYLARNPRPLVPADLDRHNCISYRLMSGGGFFPWKLESNGREVRVRAEGQLVVADSELANNLMLGGAGLILKPEAAPALADGRLVHVLEDWCIPFDAQYLYYPSKQVTPALRTLIEALRSQPGAQAERDGHSAMKAAKASL